jgi:hypothetical protein
VAVADLLLVALFDTSPAEPEAAVMVDADDAAFCQRVTYPLRWPGLVSAFAPLSSVMARQTPVPEAQVAAVCRHGRVHRIDVAPFDGLMGNLTPFGDSSWTSPSKPVPRRPRLRGASPARPTLDSARGARRPSA